LFYWLFEIEIELQQGRKMVDEYKMMMGFNNNQNNDFEQPEDESDDDD
jgi:hypothetical protein